jgi:3-oxoacyl-[acyl-carrier-protein] synthase-3
MILHLNAIASALPEQLVDNSFFPGVASSKSKMFVGSRERRHVSRDETSVDLFERAARKVEVKARDRLGAAGLDAVDAILTNVSLPDLPFTGCGAALAQRLALRPKLVTDFHSGGCVSFLTLLDHARALAAMHGLRNILICVGQTAAGRIFGHDKIRQKPQSAIPGDGAAVALVTPEGDSPITPILQRCHPEYASDMSVRFDDGHKYWEPGLEPGYLDFPEDKVSSILMRGNRLVPSIMRELLTAAGLKSSQIDGLVTNQPNPFFLRNWREAVQIPEERHFHSFETLANLFQAGIPVNLDQAIEDGRIRPGNRILLAGFSHAGDYSAAALLTWRASAAGVNPT